MKYFLLILSLSTLTFFYKGLEKDPTLIPSNLIEKKVQISSKKKQISSLLLKDRILFNDKQFKIVNFFASGVHPVK